MFRKKPKIIPLNSKRLTFKEDIIFMKEKLLNNKLIRKIVEKRGTLKHDSINCVLCGKCADICNIQSITVNRKEKELHINHDKCVRCSCCVKTCPKSALTINKN